jgi:tetratricopeptide (TPR) repeat protein
VKGTKLISGLLLASACTIYGATSSCAAEVSSLQQAVSAYRSGNVHLALRHLYWRVASGNATPGDYLYIGHCLFSQGDVHGAVAAYSNALQQNPRLPDAYNGLAKSYVALGNLRYASAVKARALQYGCPVDVSTAPPPPLKHIGS